jgi:eukaryotic-like serine/threonine-protein kinase
MTFICPKCSESSTQNDQSDEHICPSCHNSFPADLEPADQKSSTETNLPEFLGAYKVEKELAFGAVGKVYLGKHKTLNIPVAIKVLSRKISENIVTSQRFIREAKAAAQMNHINIVRILDCGVQDETIYYVMEFVKGGSTGDKLRKDKIGFNEDEVLAIGQSVCRALAEAQKFNIVHRDIKPDNIMIVANGLYKLADLGLAKLSNDNNHTPSPGLTGYQIGMGTPHFMAPEQAIDAKNVDQRADLYSLGVTMYQLATNKLPYPGSDVGAVLRKHAVKPIPNASDENPQLSQEFSTMIKKCMAKLPEDRYESAQELEIHLSKLRAPFIGNKPIHQDTVTDMSDHIFSSITQGKSRQENPPRANNKKNIAIIILLSIIIILAISYLLNLN